MTNYQQGIEVLMKLAGDKGKQAVADLHAFSPDLARLIIEFGFGEIYSRPVFDLKQRELITLSSLITQGAGEVTLGFHFNSALNIGITMEELIEIIFHCAGYAGVPCAVSAMHILKKVAEQRECI
ncbi:carboxymuconolactone decarboxylase family protein [Propionispora vibrioides]|jgi:4-carboxymuconolactone decarboxylase|uniref:4-carboxymuconolactone decarboxylase n=1 Tax=Propionispora vibrioides TaxID=112903 RepID=A0A1H8VFW2_9FIRM|nr:carboxymuconolactone decarboxylase family protein [Propionispora vibrioides]SEP14285.1 4-carboxymuconolactone decarboxylase [Propionispora vibrioides]